MSATDNTPPAVEQTPDRTADLQPIIESITQREKFLLANRLDRPFHEIMEDPDRVLLALAWVKKKREDNGIAPNFDDLLDLTDKQLIELLGLDDAAGEDEDPKAG